MRTGQLRCPEMPPTTRAASHKLPTARRAWVRLRDEHDEEVSYSYVAKYVARRRPEVEAEAKGRRRAWRGSCRR